jgi:ABC-2 type transport system ATP-binding protein
MKGVKIMNEFITVNNLTKRFGELTAVDNLSFNVEEGEIFGFLGPNGAGKTTTLNILSTLLEADSGEVTVDGLDLKKNEREIKSIIGLVPQEIAFYKNLTARENVTFFASLYGLKGKVLKEAVDEALSFVGLEGETKKRSGKLSGGMQRRLNIACGIAHKPKLIVMDEPTVGVDAKSRELIMHSIRTLRDGGATIIYTSHYMPEVQEICDRIAIISSGRLAAIGTETELLSYVTNHKTVVIETENTDEEIFSKALRILGTIPGVSHSSRQGNENIIDLDVDLTFSNITPILGTLLDCGISVRSIDSEAPNLETTFLALTGSELNKEETPHV